MCTTTICCLLGIQTALRMFQLGDTYSLVHRTLLLVSVHWSLGWISCCWRCPSVFIFIVFEAVVGPPLFVQHCTSVQDWSSSICSRGVYLLTYCVASVVSCFGCHMVSSVILWDAKVCCEPVDRDVDAVGTEDSSMPVECSCQLLFWRWVPVRCLSDSCM
jgi:hypothetical protein